MPSYLEHNPKSLNSQGILFALDIQPYLLRFGVFLVYFGGPNTFSSAGRTGCLGLIALFLSQVSSDQNPGY